MMLRYALLACLLAYSSARAQEPLRIGVAAPLSGANATLGAQVAAGARAAASRSGAVPVEADTQCSDAGGRAAAERLVAERVALAIGFLCTEALEAALPVLRQAGIPTIDVGIRADRFTARRRKTGNLVWRLAPRADAEAAALARLITARWRDRAFGIVDDGSVYGRELADAVRTRVEAEGLRPANLDTYRPAEEKQFGLVRRLARTGITHFFVAGDRGDVATIARDAAANGLALQLIGGEQMLDEPADAAELPPGTLAVGPQTRFPRFGAPPEQANAVERQGYFGPAFVAAEIAATAAGRSRDGGQPLATVLDGTEFATDLGPVRFDANGDSDLDLFRVFVFDGRDFVPEAGG